MQSPAELLLVERLPSPHQEGLLRHLRSRPRMTMTWRVGFRWQSVEGAVTLIGPDDPLDGFDPARLPQLLRDVFLCTGATHDDWPTYDRVMAEDDANDPYLADLQKKYGGRP